MERNGGCDCDSGVICGHFARRHFIYHLRWSGIGFALRPGIGIGIAGSLDLDARFRDEPEIWLGTRVSRSGGDRKNIFAISRFRRESTFICAVSVRFGFLFVFVFCFVSGWLPAFGLINDARRDNDACIPDRVP